MLIELMFCCNGEILMGKIMISSSFTIPLYIPLGVVSVVRIFRWESFRFFKKKILVTHDLGRRDSP